MYKVLLVLFEYDCSSFFGFCDSHVQGLNCRGLPANCRWQSQFLSIPTIFGLYCCFVVFCRGILVGLPRSAAFSPCPAFADAVSWKTTLFLSFCRHSGDKHIVIPPKMGSLAERGNHLFVFFITILYFTWLVPKLFACAELCA